MFTGSVRLECEGGFPERFLNEAAKRDVELWNISYSGMSLFCCCKAHRYRELRPAARAASVRMRVKRRYGLPFYLRPFRLRWGLALGALLFVVMLQLLSSRLWVVRIAGNEQVSEQAIREVLHPLGVYEGASLNKIDLPVLQLTALEQLPQLVWLTVNFEGSTAQVEVRERQVSQPIAADTPANVVSVRDGVIVRMDAVSGQAMVKVGDAVTEGTLLISGVMDSKVGPILKRADGVVTARTTRTLTVTVPFEESVPRTDPRTVSRPCLYVLGARIPLYASVPIEGAYTEKKERYPLRVNGKALPVGVEVTRFVFDESEICKRTENETKQEALSRLSQLVETLRGEVTIESESVTEQKTTDGWVITGSYTCLETIGQSVAIELPTK